MPDKSSVGEDQKADRTREYLAQPDLTVVRRAAGPEEGRGYGQVFLRSLIPGGRVTFALYLKSLEKNSELIHFLPYCAAGETLQTEWLANLRERGIDRLYFRGDDLANVIAYLNNYLMWLDQENLDEGATKMTVLYDHLHLSLQNALAAADLGASLTPTVQQAEQILSEFEKGALPIKSLWDILSLEYNLYTHAVNVFLISTGFLRFLKKDYRDARTMGIAALFHDIGLVKVNQEILYKPRALTEDERRLVQRHPQVGVDLLQGCPAVPMECLRLVLEHHENCDGSGYPQGFEMWRQHPFTPILRLVDAYDALTGTRPHRAAHTPVQALEVMRTQQGPAGPVFDQGLLKALIKFMAL